MATLRDILPEGWASGMSRDGIINRPIPAEAFATSFGLMQLVWAQIVAHLVLTQWMLELQLFDASNAPSSLAEALGVAHNARLLPPKDEGILRAVNRRANEAKHNLVFASRL